MILKTQFIIEVFEEKYYLILRSSLAFISSLASFVDDVQNSNLDACELELQPHARFDLYYSNSLKVKYCQESNQD